MANHNGARKLLTWILTIALLMGMTPMSVAMTEPASGCAHAHGPECGYIAPDVGVDCLYGGLGRHTPGEGTPFDHDAHDEICGYIEAAPGAPCGHDCAQSGIASFAALDDETAFQAVEPGTEKSALNLPAALAVVYTCGAAGEVAVTWTPDREYDPWAAGEYIFTADVPGAPEIAVTVAIPVMLMSAANYDDADIAAMIVIANATGLTLVDASNPDADMSDPSTWIGGLVDWTEDGGALRITGLNLRGRGLSGGLDARGLSKLQRLDCSGNALTEVNVASMNSLIYADVSGNALTALSISGCAALTTLDCADNRLTALALTGCTSIARLWCSGNQLGAIDISAFDKAGLYLDFGGNLVATFKNAERTANAASDDGEAYFTAYDAGTKTLTFEATPAAGMAFDGWAMQSATMPNIQKRAKPDGERGAERGLHSQRAVCAGEPGRPGGGVL